MPGNRNEAGPRRSRGNAPRDGEGSLQDAENRESTASGGGKPDDGGALTLEERRAAEAVNPERLF